MLPNSNFIKKLCYNPELEDCKLDYVPSRKHYISIGSIANLIDITNGIMWRTGMINAHILPKRNNVTFLSVRGPKTRQILSKHYDIPEMYGDPLIIAPLAYPVTPIVNNEEEYDYGLLLHYIEEDLTNQNLKFDVFKNKKVKVLSIRTADKPMHLIKELNNCKTIISSSLHEVILSVCYKKSNLGQVYE